MQPSGYLAIIGIAIALDIVGIIMVFLVSTFLGLFILVAGGLISGVTIMRMAKEPWYRPGVPIWKLGK